VPDIDLCQKAPPRSFTGVAFLSWENHHDGIARDDVAGLKAENIDGLAMRNLHLRLELRGARFFPCGCRSHGNFGM
jgi:hypothetical protein